MWKETVQLENVYDFDYNLKRISMDPLINVDRQERMIDVPIKLDDNYHIVTVKALGTTAEPEFLLSSDSISVKTELLKVIHAIFQWDMDLDMVMQHFLDTNLSQLFYAHPGTPIVRDFDKYYALMKGIIHQQLNMKFAYTLSTRFVEKYGEKVDGVWFYPDPGKVAEADYEDLKKMQFSQRKAEYVIDTSRLIADGKLNLDELSGKSREEIKETLVKIRGIGPWTAESWLLFGLGKQDELPLADIGIQNALKFYFQQEKKPSIEEMKTWSKSWSPYQSYACITLWRSIEND